MDEASSRFVDRLVLERLLGEKLAKVSHRPHLTLEQLLRQKKPQQQFQASRLEVRMGPEPTSYLLGAPGAVSQADHAFCRVVARRAKAPRGAILLAHGLYEDCRAIYDFLVNELVRLGYSVYLTTLPYHYERKPATSAFSGEYFFSADLGRTRDAFWQASSELQYTLDWLETELDVPVFVVGFSMGGAVALDVAASNARVRGVAIINPAAGLSRVFWTSPLSATIRADLVQAGWGEIELARFVATFDPFHAESIGLAREKILMIYALYDQITLEEQYQALVKRWALSEVLRYKAGHLNTLRVPRLAEDLVRFFDRLLPEAERRSKE